MKSLSTLTPTLKLILALSLISTLALAKTDTVPSARPADVDVHFQESDFEAKPWLKEFGWVVVVNRANDGSDKQSIRIYRNQTLIQFDEVRSYLLNLQMQQDAARSNDPNRKDRLARIEELAAKQWSPGVFKVSTGRDSFEAKGEHHSQHDSWSTTPTGFFVPQSFQAKHKSESYSNKLCDTFAGKLLGAVLRKKMCTFMENATFFNEGIALHKAIPGTEPDLGTKASGGCVRLPAALAEFLFLNFQEAQGQPVPLVSVNGDAVLDATGSVVRELKHHGPWGDLAARSVLIIVQNQP